ncbi:histidine kinase [Leucobacter zeae]|nr:histidine kinase [Leucobacter zeae]
MARRIAPRAARLGVLLLPVVIVLACVGITAAIALGVQERGIRETTAERVSDVATSLAELDQVRSALAGPDARPHDALTAAERDAILAAAAHDLQPLADVVSRAAGVDYVVIADDRGLRATHPDPEKRGGRVSTDHAGVLAGETYVGTEAGTLGPTLRAKVPVRSGAGDVIGVVSVGILETRIAAEFDEALGRLLPWVVGALVAGTLASSFIAAAIERRFRRLDEAAREVDQLTRTATALREQSHEFHTRLHVIHGLVSHGDTAEALGYIGEIAPVLTGAEDEALAGRPLLRATLEALRAELAALGAVLEASVDVSSEVDAEVTLVLANLCRNAGEAGASRVECALHERDGRFIGSVDDDGPGIDAAAAERVFARGYSSKPDPTGAGRGIGLDLVRRTVGSRGGAVEVGRSRLGGARFRFEMEALR